MTYSPIGRLTDRPRSGGLLPPNQTKWRFQTAANNLLKCTVPNRLLCFPSAVDQRERVPNGGNKPPLLELHVCSAGGIVLRSVRKHSSILKIRFGRTGRSEPDRAVADNLP